MEAREEAEVRLLGLAQDLEVERSGARAAVVQVGGLEAALIRKEDELEQALSRRDAATQALDEANLRAAALERALAESDARAASLRDARDELSSLLEQLRAEQAVKDGAPPGSAPDAGDEAQRGTAVVAVGGQGASVLEQLRTEAVLGEQRAAAIEGRALALLDEFSERV